MKTFNVDAFVARDRVPQRIARRRGFHGVRGYRLGCRARGGEDARDATRATEASTSRTLFENAHVIVINKWHNTSFHSEFAPGVVATVRRERATNGREGDVFAVHRLDKSTSGILILGKTKDVANALSKAFEERRIIKYYVGVATKRPKKKMGTIEGDMTRSRAKQWMLTRTMSSASAVTKFTSFGAIGANGAARRMFVFKPLTGKTHQLRVAAKSLGSALLGDDLYGGDVSDRCYLHAAAIRIPALFDGFDPIQVICDPSDEGEEWDATAFSTYFPPELALDFGEWFSELPLLKSALS